MQILILAVLAPGALGNQQINNVYMLWVPAAVAVLIIARLFGHLLIPPATE